MNKTCLLLLALIYAGAISGQNIVKVKVIDAETKEALSGVSVMAKGDAVHTTTKANGEAVFVLPNHKMIIYFTHVGFESQDVEIGPPFSDTTYLISLVPKDEEEEEVIIQSTRSSRSIQDIPTRVEFVAGEELDEKANMKPGDIRMVLNESTGITTQQTSATSANASIRIQGLDGRYTQILKDGFPLYAGFSSGLGLLQTPPLDLKQFEVIKGSASTLYGGGAIAGLVNLISKTPAEKRELNFHLDATSAGGLSINGFYGQRFKKAGITVFASRNSNKPYDPADIGLTAIPKYERYTVNPKLFVYFSERTEMVIGGNISTEKRTGGELSYIKGNNPSGFFEANNSDRYSSELTLRHLLGKSVRLQFKNSFGRFQRIISSKGYTFNGEQNSSFSELTFHTVRSAAEWIMGLNLLTDDFKEKQLTATPLRNYQQLTTGVFVQNNWKVTEKFRLESGLRGDFVRDYGFAFLPRVSALVKISQKVSSRIGGGLGYKAPTIFTEESERLQYKDVLPVDKQRNKLERSYGVNADINYKTKLESGISISINHLFFYTRIADPLLLQPAPGGYQFNNIGGHIDSKGMETNVKLGYRDFKLFLGYTFTDAYLHQGATKQETWLTPRHRLNNVLMYEVEEKWKLGLEAYYFSRQQLSDGNAGKSYWITGFMAEKLWKKISLYINFENFLDSRQTKFDTIFTGAVHDPVFRDIYAPLDGFVINGGVKLRL